MISVPELPVAQRNLYMAVIFPPHRDLVGHTKDAWTIAPTVTASTRGHVRDPSHTQTGIRYLENAILKLDYSQLRLVYEALKERATLLRLAPHLAGKSDSEYNFSPVPLLLLLLLPFLPFLP